MSLRRTALARRTELRRTPMPRRSRELKSRAKRTIRRQADTGPTVAQRILVLDRAGGCCELCGVLLHDGYGWVGEHSFHHRLARGMGGTSRAKANSPANLLLLCGSGITGCHGLIENSRTFAYACGWLVKHGHDPAEVPVVLHPFAARVLLTHDGTYEEVA